MTKARGSQFRPLVQLAALTALALTPFGCSAASEEDSTRADEALRRNRCGNGSCNYGETCASCPKDCGACAALDAGVDRDAADTSTADAGADPAPPASPDLYVSATSGNDSWSGALPAPNGTGTDGPLRTLARAQSVARASARKRIGVEAGTYTLTGNWLFGSSDSGETWLSYPGPRAAVIDGASAYYVSASGATNLSVSGFTFQYLVADPHFGADFSLARGSGYSIRWNTFLGCIDQCVVAQGVNNSTIDSNTVNGQSPGNIPGQGIGSAFSAIAVSSWTGASAGVTISHNLIENTQGGAIDVSTGPTDGDITSAVVTKNLIRNVNTNCADSGAIYFGDTGPNTASNMGNRATYNVIDGNGTAANSTKCLYLDGGASNITVSGNICAPADGASEAAGSAVAGEAVVFIHGGQNNVVTYNIIVAGTTTSSFTDVWGSTQNDLQAIGYQSNAGAGYGISTSMTGNVFAHNIFFSFGKWPDPLWFISGTVGAPSVSNNAYHSATGAVISRYGFSDNKPVFDDPLFVNVSGNDYTVGAGSSLFSGIGWQALPTDQGPLPYAP